MTDFGPLDRRRLRHRGSGDRPRPRRPRRRASPRSAVVQRPAGDDEPPRADRRRDRHRQDEDAAAGWPSSSPPPACPCSCADVKGDLSGLAVPGDRRRAWPRSAMADLGHAVRPDRVPGRVPRRSAASARASRCGRPCRDFGPQLLAKVLGANETQERASALVFHYADSKGLPLLDLADLRALLTYLTSDAGQGRARGHRRPVERQTVGVLLRALVGLETGGGNELFGEPQLDIADLLRVAADGRGVDLLPRAAGRAGQARRCSRPRSCGSSPSCSRRCPRPATCPSRSSSSSSTRPTCCSPTRRRRSSTSVARPCG